MTELRRLSAALVLSAAVAAPLAARAANTIVSGSVYVDYHGIPDSAVRSRAPRSIGPDASLKLQVEVNDDVTFSAKVCASCHTLELDHAVLDWQPETWFNVQVGRLAVPFGEYAERVDASAHKTASPPLVYDMGQMAFGGASALNLGVLPQPYVDTGMLLYGQRWLAPTLQMWYGAYVVGGLKGSNDVQWARMRGGNYSDNNATPAGGGRVAFTLAGTPGGLVGDANVGGSFTGGRYDDAGRLAYWAWGTDATIRIAKATLRGEYVHRRTELDPNVSYAFALVDRFFEKSGWYAELEHPAGRYVSLVGRVDQLRRAGASLPGSDDPSSTFSRITRWTAGAVVTPTSALYVKTGWEYWKGAGYPSFSSFHLGFGGVF